MPETILTPDLTPLFDATAAVPRTQRSRAALTADDRKAIAATVLGEYDSADQRRFLGCAKRAAEGDPQRVFYFGTDRFEPGDAANIAKAINAAADFFPGLERVKAIARKPPGMSASPTREVYVYLSSPAKPKTPVAHTRAMLAALREAALAAADESAAVA